MVLYSRWSNLSLVDVNQRKAVSVVFLNCDWICEKIYQKESVKVLKQPNSKSITVLKRRLIQYDKKLTLRAAAAL